MSRTLIERIQAKTTPCGDCHRWEGSMGGTHYGIGTPQISLLRAKLYVRRILMAAKLKVEALPAGMVVTVTCNNPRCVNPAHLEMISKGEVCRRAGAQGKYSSTTRAMKQARLKQALHSRLDMDKVREIRASSESTKVVALRMGISYQSAHKIRRGERWKEYSNPFNGLGGR